MKISNAGLAIIKKYEGVRLSAYKDAVGVWTIGYGHTKGVRPGQRITQAQADAFLRQDCAVAERNVSKFDSKYHWSQNQFDALVSFAFNIGSIDQLTANGTRTIQQISNKIPAYNKAGGRVLKGLVRRRKEEKALFDKVANNNNNNNNNNQQIASNKYFPATKRVGAGLASTLASIGVDSSYSYRKKIAIANGIKNYSGKAVENTKLLVLLEQGKLIKP
nr:MAG TPA: Lysozyme [Bacteriophage sp.]